MTDSEFITRRDIERVKGQVQGIIADMERLIDTDDDTSMPATSTQMVTYKMIQGVLDNILKADGADYVITKSVGALWDREGRPSQRRTGN